jgi:hypothetical protein
MTILDHLRAVLATVNDKAYRSGEDQAVIEAARRALAEADKSKHFRRVAVPTLTPAELDAASVELNQATARLLAEQDRAYWEQDLAKPVADQRAAFVQAMQDGPRNAPDAQGVTQLGGEPEDAATGSVVRSAGCSEMEQVPK